MKNYWPTVIWTALAIGLVVYLWWTGQLTRLADYVRETREELKKCTWPTWNELKGSTVVVLISVIILGGFTVIVDYFFAAVIHWIT